MIKKLSRFLIAITILSLVCTSVYADQPPDPGGGPGGEPVGGGAPIGGGLIITMILAAAYGTRKIISYPNNK